MVAYSKIGSIGVYMMLFAVLEHAYLGLNAEIGATVALVGFHLFVLSLASMAYSRYIYPRIMKQTERVTAALVS